MENKTFRMSIKEVGEQGKFTGYLSVFGNVDHGGDLVEKGAFKKTLSENEAFPLLWAHSSQKKDDLVGTFHGQEDKYGLLIDGEFFLDQPGGKQAYDLVKRLSEKKVKVGLSIGYKAIQFEDETSDNQTVRRLKEIQLFEGSLTLFPMNDQAVVLAVKEGLEDTTQKPKTVAVICGKCGERVMEITDHADDKAFDDKEPDEKSTPKTEPPAEAPANRAVREFVESVRGSIKNLTN